MGVVSSRLADCCGFTHPDTLARTEGTPVSQRGSILIDQLVALALLGLLLVGVFSLLTTGSLAAQLVRQSTLAGGVAAQKMEEILNRSEEPVSVPRQPVDALRIPPI